MGKIISVDEHPDAEKLYVLQVDLGKEKRQLVAGLKEHYSKKELENKKIIVVSNLKYAKLRSIESQGMLLAGDDGKNVGILTVKDSKVGTNANFGNLKNLNENISFDSFQKINIIVKNGKVFYDELELKADKEDVFAEKIKNGRVR